VTRLLPAHVILGGCALGLGLADVLRLHGEALVMLAPLAAAVALRGSSRLAAAALLAGCAGWWWGSVRLDRLDHSVLAGEVGTAGDFVVVTPSEARRGRFDQRQFARALHFEGTALDERVELELPPGRAPPQGARVRLLARVAAPRGPSHGFDERTWLRRQGVHVVLRVDRFVVVGRRGGLGGIGDRLRTWLRKASTPGLAGERRALVDGIVLGDDAGLSDGLKRAFRRSGLYHLLAVSGQNVVLLAAGMLALGLLLGVPRAAAHVAALAAIGSYVLAVGPQPSVIRAAVAGAAVSVAWLLGRQREAWHVLLLAAVVLLAWNPYAAFDAGFELSFAAVAAIFLLGGPLVRVLEGYPLPGRVRSAVAIAAACSVVTAPILWAQFGAVPLLGVAANALVEVAVGPLLGLAFTTAVVDLVSPTLAAWLASANGVVAAYVAICARAVAAVPFAQASGRGAALASAACFLAAALVVRGLRRGRGATC
jgi:competence protein ComEC